MKRLPTRLFVVAGVLFMTAGNMPAEEPAEDNPLPQKWGKLRERLAGACIR